MRNIHVTTAPDLIPEACRCAAASSEGPCARCVIEFTSLSSLHVLSVLMVTCRWLSCMQREREIDTHLWAAAFIHMNKTQVEQIFCKKKNHKYSFMAFFWEGFVFLKFRFYSERIIIFQVVIMIVHKYIILILRWKCG